MKKTLLPRKSEQDRFQTPRSQPKRGLMTQTTRRGKDYKLIQRKIKWGKKGKEIRRRRDMKLKIFLFKR